MKQLIRLGSILIFSLISSCGEEKKEGDKTNVSSVNVADSIENQSKEIIYTPEIIKGTVTKTLTAGETSETSRIYFEYFKLDEKSPSYLKSVNELISRAVQSDFEEPDKEKITANLSTKYFSDILSEFKKSFSNVDEEFMPWSLLDSLDIDDSKLDFTHLTTITYSFTGGAHGNGYESHHLIDKKTGKILGIKDFFTSEKKLNALVDSYFRKSIGVSQNENLQDAGWFIEGRLETNNNFYFTDKKVVFVYNSYEIGPYAVGAPNVEIPLSKIKEILKLSLN